MSNRTKHTNITLKVRKAVKERDRQRCVVCGITYTLQLAHVFVNRSHGGLGIEENLATLCVQCHMSLDSGREEQAKPIRNYCEAYLKDRYEIDIEKLKYRKWNNV